MKKILLIALILIVFLWNAFPGFCADENIQPPKDYLDRSGIKELVVWQAFNGFVVGALTGSAFFAGKVERYCLEGTDEEASKECRDAGARSGGIVMFSLAAGLAVPILATRNKQVTTSDAILVNRSTLIGLMHGYIIPFSAGVKPLEDTPEIDPDADNIRWLSAYTVLGDLFGIGIGTYLAYEFEPTPGLVSFIGTIHMSTYLAAISIGGAYVDELNQENNRKIQGISLGIADLALGASLYLHKYIDIGRNRVFWLDTGGMVGWIAGGGIGSLIGGDDQRSFSVGSTIGLFVGIVTTYLAGKDSEEWRNRVSLDQDNRISFQLQAPRLSVRPEKTHDGKMAIAYYADIVRGTW